MRILFIVMLFISSLVKAQSDSEIGVVAGGAYYIGDINMSRHFYKTSPAVGLIYKYNLSNRFALRASTLFSELKAKDADFANTMQQERNLSFESKIIDIAAGLEFNFKPFWAPREFDTFNWTPYVYVGLGYVQLENRRDFTIPFGGGAKFLMSRNFIAAVEWSFRKAARDNIDEVNNPVGVGSSPSLMNTDWYSYMGVTLTYRFSSDKACDLFDKLFR